MNTRGTRGVFPANVGKKLPSSNQSMLTQKALKLSVYKVSTCADGSAHGWSNGEAGGFYRRGPGSFLGRGKSISFKPHTIAPTVILPPTQHQLHSTNTISPLLTTRNYKRKETCLEKNSRVATKKCQK